MKKIILLVALIAAASCKNETDTTTANITDPADYQQYLNNDETTAVENLKTELTALRQEAAGDTTRIVVYGQIAGKLDELFDLTGDVTYLNESVRFRESVTRNTYIRPDNSKRTLAQAYIKQHRFKMADSLMQEVTEEYVAPESRLIQFDIAMELGEYQTAEQLLDSLRNPNDYSYLIRAAKWNDHIGQLGTTITLMERAMKLAEEGGNPAAKLWSYSNIADYYGHHGDIEKSYQHYLKTLENDPTNTYALKGIAWIAYSNDRDVDEARIILERLSQRHPSPDYKLELAELEEFEEDEAAAIALKDEFMGLVNDSAYGGMYNAYKISELIDSGKTQEAVELAKIEVGNRSTPETYDLLGYALLENGEEQAALENHKTYVIGKTFEPKAQLHTALIYRANGMNNEAEELKKELLETEYEMGPVTFKKIQQI